MHSFFYVPHKVQETALPVCPRTPQVLPRNVPLLSSQGGHPLQRAVGKSFLATSTGLLTGSLQRGRSSQSMSMCPCMCSSLRTLSLPVWVSCPFRQTVLNILVKGQEIPWIKCRRLTLDPRMCSGMHSSHIRMTPHRHMFSYFGLIGGVGLC